jgi:hypothetical protein
MEIRKNYKAEVPCFDFEKISKIGFKEIQVSEESGVVKYIPMQTSDLSTFYYDSLCLYLFF